MGSYIAFLVFGTRRVAGQGNGVVTLLDILFNYAPTTVIYVLSLHDALPIYASLDRPDRSQPPRTSALHVTDRWLDRKSTRLKSSHQITSHADFCLKKRSAGLEFLDIGAGLGVDYDGAQPNFESSVHYSLNEH